MSTPSLWAYWPDAVFEANMRAFAHQERYVIHRWQHGDEWCVHRAGRSCPFAGRPARGNVGQA